MYDTPAPLRGAMYNTHLYARCPEFHQCHRCRMCTSYNQHNPACVACESNKPGGRHHICKPHQVAALIQLEDRLGRPFASLNQNPSNVDERIMNTSLGENAELMERLQAQEWAKGR